MTRGKYALASGMTGMSGLSGMAGAAFSPSDVSGLSLWLKADAGVYSDAGTTPATNGQLVYQWNDQSGSNNHVTQAVAGSRWTYYAPGSGDIGFMQTASKWMNCTTATFPNGANQLAFFVLVEDINDSDAVLIDTNNGSGIDIWCGIAGRVVAFFTIGSGNTVDRTGQPADILEFIYDGTQATNLTKWVQRVNGQTVAGTTNSGTVPTALAASNGITIGRANPSGYGWGGRLREVLVYSGTAYQAYLTQIRAYLRQRADAGTRPLVVCTGDSLTAGGTAGAGGYPSAMLATLGTGWRVLNFGVSGQTIEGWLATTDFTMPTSGHTKDIEVCGYGRNDLATVATAETIEARLTTYWAAARARGFQVVAITYFDNNGVDDVKRGAVNTWVAAQTDKWDALADLATAPELSDYTDATYFQADGVHLKTAGYAVMASVIGDQVSAL